MNLRKDSKMIFAESLIELSKKKPVEKITVKEITENASFSRENFYYHFDDKYDLLYWMYNDEGDKIINTYYEKESWGSVLARFLDYLKENQHFYVSAFKDRTPGNFHDVNYEFTTRMMSECIMKKLEVDDLPDETKFYVSYAAHAGNDLAEEIGRAHV